MIETKCNYKRNFINNLKCDLCNMNNDTTEHIIECKVTQYKTNSTVDDIKQCNINVVKDIREVINKREELGHKVKIKIGNEDE